MLLIGERYRKRLEAGLRSHTAEPVIWLPDNTAVDPRLAGHADLGVFIPDDKHVFIAEEYEPLLVNLLTNRGFEVIPISGQAARYPADAGLCVCRTGKTTIYNSKTVSECLKPYLNGVLIDVPQGYTKCSVCVVTVSAIITADEVIAERCSSANMDVLRLSPGHITLEGYDYGFIGGAAFLLDDRTLAFTGTLDEHPDRDRILDFLQRHGVSAVFLTESPIFDIGGAVRLP